MCSPRASAASVPSFHLGRVIVQEIARETCPTAEHSSPEDMDCVPSGSTLSRIVRKAKGRGAGAPNFWDERASPGWLQLSLAGCIS
jgi:hypothetical protein